MDSEAEVIEPFEVNYSDLVLLSSSQIASSSVSTEQLEKIESISDAVMRVLGPSGPGLLSITGVPKASELRRSLLPIARELALLEDKKRAQVLKDNGLGSDVSLKNHERSVSSFAMQLKYEQFSNLESISSLSDIGKKDYYLEMQKGGTVNEFFEHYNHEQHLIGDIFEELGLCMIELGLRLAHFCDKMIGGSELGQSILDAGTAKGRLIHYHSVLDKFLLKEENKRTKGSISISRPTISSLSSLPTNSTSSHDSSSSSDNGGISSRKCFLNTWQQWHYDYSIFTVLTSPLFMSSYWMNGSLCAKNCLSPDGHTYMQIFDSNNDKVLLVKASPESFIVQVGESADILTNGKLRSTLHSVGRPLEIENLCRENFVVFLQPAWDKVLPFPSYLMNDDAKCENVFTSKNASPDAHMVKSEDSHNLVQGISRFISPLSSRLEHGMTFAEFSRQTTKKYYGGSGTQSGKQ